MQLHEGRPKQKRHRCRNPNKLDVNSLTGEERVQLINRRNARKVLAYLLLIFHTDALCKRSLEHCFIMQYFLTDRVGLNLEDLRGKTRTTILCSLISNPTPLAKLSKEVSYFLYLYLCSGTEPGHCI